MGQTEVIKRVNLEHIIQGLPLHPAMVLKHCLVSLATEMRVLYKHGTTYNHKSVYYPKFHQVRDKLTNIYIWLKGLTSYSATPLDRDTKGAIESVHIKGVSILSRLNLEKM